MKTIYRISDKETLPYKIDIYGDQVSFMWYGPEDPDPSLFKKFDQITNDLKASSWFCRNMVNRGRQPNAKKIWTSDTVQEKWQAQENGLLFELRLNDGQSPGLFVDQRRNRKTVFDISNKKEVLNLFSYTGGFSVAAAAGGATQTTTVDLSPKYIEWSKINFELNKIDTSKHEFWSADARVFLAGCQRRERKFDIIVCDPPSFGRSREGTFRVEKEYPNLIKACSLALRPNGRILFSTNYEGWDRKTFQKHVFFEAKNNRLKVLDFPKTESDIESDNMKSVWLKLAP